MTGRNFLSQEEIPCHRKKFPVPGAWGKFYVTVSRFHTDKHLFLGKFQVHVEISYDDISFTGRKSLQRKKFASLIEYYFAGKKFALQKKKNHLIEEIVWPKTFLKLLKAISPLLK